METATRAAETVEGATLSVREETKRPDPSMYIYFIGACSRIVLAPCHPDETLGAVVTRHSDSLHNLKMFMVATFYGRAKDGKAPRALQLGSTLRKLDLSVGDVVSVMHRTMTHLRVRTIPANL